MRRLLVLLAILAAVSLSLLLPNDRGSRKLVVRPVLADDGNVACLLPPESGELDDAGNKVTWLPKTPDANETKVPPQRSGGTDCPFYKPAWQRFMVATQPIGNVPAFLSYPSFDDLFPIGSANPSSIAVAHPLKLSLHPRNIQLPNSPTDSQQAIIDSNQVGISDINQAGPHNATGGNLIDQHGHLIFYAIHVNPAFRTFLTTNNLRTVEGLAQLKSDHVFPTGVMELKSAWMIVDSPQVAPNYFVVRAEVPFYSVINGTLQQDRTLFRHPKTRPVWAALIAIHVVFTLPGHPEMIWSTFEHTHLDQSGTAVRDNAPPAPAYPAVNPDTTVVDTHDWALYKANTIYSVANHPALVADMVAHWDSNDQSFTKGGILQTSVFRPYPASKAKGTGAVGPDEDDEVVLINKHATEMFDKGLKDGSMPKSDMRQNYRLVGAVWLDQPLTGTAPSFTVGRGFSTDDTVSTDDSTSEIAGEGRLGSTAMESFTQTEDGAPSCFSCHDTQAIRHNRLLLHPAKLNVSHVMSKFLDSQPIPPAPPAPPTP